MHYVVKKIFFSRIVPIKDSNNKLNEPTFFYLKIIIIKVGLL